MSQTLKTSVAVIGVDIGKNSFHLVGQDRRGAIVLRQKWSRGQVEARLARVLHVFENKEDRLAPGAARDGVGDLLAHAQHGAGVGRHRLFVQ